MRRPTGGTGFHGGGGGAGANIPPLSSVLFADAGTTVPVEAQNGSIAAPFATSAQLIEALHTIEVWPAPWGCLAPGIYDPIAEPFTRPLVISSFNASPLPLGAAVFSYIGEELPASASPLAFIGLVGLGDIRFAREDGVLRGSLDCSGCSVGTCTAAQIRLVDCFVSGDGLTAERVFLHRTTFAGGEQILIEAAEANSVLLTECHAQAPVHIEFGGAAGVVLVDEYTADRFAIGLFTVTNGVVRVRGVQTFASQTLVTLNVDEIGAFDFPVPGLEEGMGVTLTIWQEPGPILDLQVMSQKSKAGAVEVWLKNEGASPLTDETVVVQGTAFYPTVLG